MSAVNNFVTDYLAMRALLHHALCNLTGKLRVSDAYPFCGIEPRKVNQDQISRFDHAIRELGWERQGRRFDGSFQHAYVKGATTEREVDENTQQPTNN